MERITVRGSKFAKIGLKDMIDFIDLRGKEIIEIGSYVGDSTEIFAQNCSKVISIDPFKNGYDDSDQSSYVYPMSVIEAQFNDMRKNYSNIEKLRMTSIDASFLFKNNTIENIYIDALHTYEGVKQDIVLWLPKMKIGGWMCFHDWQDRFLGVKQAIREFFGEPDKIFRDTSCVVKLSKDRYDKALKCLKEI